MTEETNQLLREALKLPPEGRAALAGSLLESLHEAIDEDAEEAWAMEIAKRAVELDEGSIATVPWAEARPRIAGR